MWEESVILPFEKLATLLMGQTFRSEKQKKDQSINDVMPTGRGGGEGGAVNQQ